MTYIPALPIPTSSTLLIPTQPSLASLNSPSHNPINHQTKEKSRHATALFHPCPYIKPVVTSRTRLQQHICSVHTLPLPLQTILMEYHTLPLFPIEYLCQCYQKPSRDPQKTKKNIQVGIPLDYLLNDVSQNEYLFDCPTSSHKPCLLLSKPAVKSIPNSCDNHFVGLILSRPKLAVLFLFSFHIP